MAIPVVILAAAATLYSIAQHPEILFVAALFSLIAAVLHWRHGWVTVDDEGVTVRTGIYNQFVPYDLIERARQRTTVENVRQRGMAESGHLTTRHLELTLRTGETLQVPARRPTELARHILDRKSAATLSRKAPPPAALARAGRSAHDWIQALRALTTERAGYRDVPLSLDALWNVVESRWQDPESRAAAAIALGHNGSPEARTRLERIANEAESRGLRIVIGRAAEDAGDDAALEASLAELQERDAEVASRAVSVQQRGHERS